MIGPGVELGIAVTAGAVTAVTRRRDGDPAPVLVNGWPTQNVDVRDEDELAATLARLRNAVRPDVNRVAVTYPGSFGAARVHRLRQAAAEAGWTGARVVSVPVAAGIGHAVGYRNGSTAVVDATGDRVEVAVLVPQPDAAWGVVASLVTGQAAQSVAATVAAASEAADLNDDALQRVVIIAEPARADETATQLSPIARSDVIGVSPVALAGDALTADHLLAGDDRSRDVPTRTRGSWPRPVSTLACTVAALVVLVAVLTRSGTAGARPDVMTFTLGCLGLFTAVMGAASFLASRSVARLGGEAGWLRAGRMLMVGVGVGVAGVVTAIVIVATVFAVAAWPLAVYGGLAVLGPAAAGSVIATNLTRHPENPPVRRLWPPVAAMTAVCAAAVVVHNAHLDSTPATGWDLLPARLGVAVWIFAIGGVYVHAPWPRVIVGLIAGAAAGLFVSAATVSVFAVVVVVTVAGWWVVTAALVTLDRHGMPELPRPELTDSAGSSTRTVH